MNIIKYAIVENEEFASLHLYKLIHTLHPEFELVFATDSVEETVKQLRLHPELDLIFMDIELDDGNCFEIFRQVDTEIPVIFTTAYDSYAIRAFKVNSIDYLLKPITEDDVEVAVNQFLKFPKRLSDVKELMRGLPSDHNRILISSGDAYSFVRLDEVAWIIAEDKCISLVLFDGKEVLTSMSSLADVSQYVDRGNFFQISRSIMASIDSISKVSKYFKGRLIVELKAGGTTRRETVSALRRNDFLNWMGHTGT